MLYGTPSRDGWKVELYTWYIKQEVPPGGSRTHPWDTSLKVCIDTQGRSIEKQYQGDGY